MVNVIEIALLLKLSLNEACICLLVGTGCIFIQSVVDILRSQHSNAFHLTNKMFL